MSFKKDFLWGSATFSYQVEGAIDADGRKESVWEMLCRKEGSLFDDHNSAKAPRHYQNYKEDIALIKDLGLKAYLFSVAWPRIMPDGIGKVNSKGLEFYDKIIDLLLEAKIDPFMTIYHWDMPLGLYYKGGWLNRDSMNWFADFTKVVVDKYSDRVSNFITVNEPQIFVGEGHMEGRHAPGDKHAFKEVLTIAHNVLLSHGMAVKTIRANAKLKPKISFASFGCIDTPLTDSKADIDAARESMFTLKEKQICTNTWWLDPVFLGKYPDDGMKLFEADLPEIKQDDMKIISEPLDFLGVNIYQGDKVRRGADGDVEVVPTPVGQTYTAIRWPSRPESMYWGPKFLYERYKKTIMVTENGMSNYDSVSLDGKVHDPQRIDYTQRHLLQLEKAINEGVPVDGYFHWSVMDNWEHVEGYRERFGLTFVDYLDNYKRIKKDSFYWYRDVIRSNGESLKDFDAKIKY